MQRPQVPKSMPEMLATLAGLPEDERAFRQRKMLDMFYGMPPERAAAMMRPMVEALVDLPEDHQRRLVESRTRVLAGFAAEKRAFLMRAHLAALDVLPGEARERDVRLTREAVERLPEKPRDMLGQMATLHRIGGAYARRLLLPALAVFGATWLASAFAFPALARRVWTGTVGGLLASLALDAVRLAGYRAGWMPLDMPVMFGRIILGPMARKRQVLAAGYAYHFLNGVDFGLFFSILIGPAHWLWGVIWAMMIAMGMAISPPVLITGSGVGMLRKGPKPMVIMMAAHLAMGTVLGLVNQRGGGPRGRSWNSSAPRGGRRCTESATWPPVGDDNGAV